MTRIHTLAAATVVLAAAVGCTTGEPATTAPPPQPVETSASPSPSPTPSEYDIIEAQAVGFMLAREAYADRAELEQYGRGDVVKWAVEAIEKAKKIEAEGGHKHIDRSEATDVEIGMIQDDGPEGRRTVELSLCMDYSRTVNVGADGKETPMPTPGPDRPDNVRESWPLLPKDVRLEEWPGEGWYVVSAVNGSHWC